MLIKQMDRLPEIVACLEFDHLDEYYNGKLGKISVANNGKG
ncbi:MAG TPA: hypothetical protein VM660_00330 [Bacillus sp. (in: firmicutes)]|jgi:hypothetical protein|nr:hypothetical protein [Bacillus sp. (in: firmicutes)]